MKIKQGFKKGDTLRCIMARDLSYSLVEGELYIAVKDEEDGIFHDRPYIKVKDLKEDKILTCYSYRFEKVEV
mgnify:CR=1 FL=1